MTEQVAPHAMTEQVAPCNDGMDGASRNDEMDETHAMTKWMRLGCD